MTDEEEPPVTAPQHQGAAPLPTRQAQRIGRHRAADADPGELNDAHLTAILRHLTLEGPEG
ncbi:MAG: hypothetical protein WCA46_19485 [Actinocatenispora sp.]